MARRKSTSRSGQPPEAVATNGTPQNTASQKRIDFNIPELVLLSTILVVGFAARWVALDRLAIEHFDEGVYASDRWFGAAEGFSYPNRHLYAPPLAPLLIDKAQSMFGVSSSAAMTPSLVLGSLTSLLVWWIARRWFDPCAGLAAAAILSLCEPHILYTRSAMTDAMLTFWLALAVALASEFFRLGARRPADRWTHAALFGLAAGVATGLAWLTKYNGWLPLAIVAAGGAAWAIFERPKLAGAAPALFGFALMSLVAAAAFALICWTLPFGYAEVSKNHAQYFSGPGAWTNNLLRQMRALHYLEGWPTTLSLTIALFLATLARGAGWRAIRNAWLPIAASAALLTAASIWLSSEIAITILGAASLVVLAIKRGRPAGEPHQHDRAAMWLLGAWFVGLFVAIPLYYPYPRLTMPWLLVATLAAGGGCSLFARRSLNAIAPGRRRHWAPATLAVSAVLLAGAVSNPDQQGFVRPLTGWPRRDSMATIAKRIAADASAYSRDKVAPGRDSFGLWVYGEPALFYHLRAGGIEALPIAHLDVDETAEDASLPAIYLVAGPHAERSAIFRKQFAARKNDLKLVATYDYLPSELAWLDNYDPADHDERPLEHVRLYLVDSQE